MVEEFNPTKFAKAIIPHDLGFVLGTPTDRRIDMKTRAGWTPLSPAPSQIKEVVIRRDKGETKDVGRYPRFEGKSFKEWIDVFVQAGREKVLRYEGDDSVLNQAHNKFDIVLAEYIGGKTSDSLGAVKKLYEATSKGGMLFIHGIVMEVGAANRLLGIWRKNNHLFEYTITDAGPQLHLAGLGLLNISMKKTPNELFTPEPIDESILINNIRYPIFWYAVPELGKSLEPDSFVDK